MNSLEEMRESLFGPRPVAQVYYAEPSDVSTLGVLMRAFSTASLDGLGLTAAEQRLVAANLHPILLVEYGFTFSNDVLPKDLLAHIRDNADEETDYAFSIFFASQETVTKIMDEFFLVMVPRQGVGGYRDDSAEFFFTAQRGDRFVTATFGLAPIPGQRCVA